MHLGTTSYMLGSVLWVLCYDSLAGSPVENMQAVWAIVKEAYRRDGSDSQFTNLTLSSFCDKSSPHSHDPQLKGKGAEIKGLVKPLLLCWHHFESSISHNYAIVLAMLEAQLRVQEVLTEFAMDLFLPKAVAAELAGLVDEVLRLYTMLANSADDDAQLLWSVTPQVPLVVALGPEECVSQPPQKQLHD